MPKKNGHKAKQIGIPATEEENNIVFGNPDSKPKKKVVTDTNEPLKNPSNGPEKSKREDTRKLIAGASWTGKLPMSLLSEHCQKMKWAKPEYTMSHIAAGYSSMVILKMTNNKTHEIMTIPPLRLPPEVKDAACKTTAVEARHFAATYALYRVCSMKNIHMMLPPDYRDLWKGLFQDLKTTDIKEGRAWLYEADPFLAKLGRDDAQKVMAKKREARDKQQAKDAENPVVSIASDRAGVNIPRHQLMKGWSRIPALEMGRQIRTDVEGLIRQNPLWNLYKYKLSDDTKRTIIAELVNIGFRKTHAMEAVEECKDKEESIEWLLIYVPEDDLPRWAMPEIYNVGISLASSDLRTEGIITRLAETGYPVDLCAKVLESSNGDEFCAAEALQQTLLARTPLPIAGIARGPGDEDFWGEELATVSSIYGVRMKEGNERLCVISLDIPEIPLIVRLRKPARYPEMAPILALCGSKLPAYIRLSIIRQAICHVLQSLLGEAMIFNIIDWLESNIPRLIVNPGKLIDIADVTCGARSTADVMADIKLGIRKPARSEKPIFDAIGNAGILKIWQEKQHSDHYQKMLAVRKRLPAWKLREQIISAVNQNQVTIISGETGSGKSTQSVQFILDDMIQRNAGAQTNIICTQPRRISALGLADRVSDERCDKIGNEIGYIIRGEAKQKKDVTRITFVTTGILLRRLQASRESRDYLKDALAGISHVFVDEVHERSLDTDFLLVLLKEILAHRKDLKVVLMSATLDAAIFKTYFGGNIAEIKIEGRTHPVKDHFLDDIVQMAGLGKKGGSNDAIRDTEEPQDEDASVARIIQGFGMRIDYELISTTVDMIDHHLGSNDGGILIFLPGVVEITRTLAALRGRHYHALPLHASLTAVEQRRIFAAAPRGHRKVIAATNVAETSITIEDIVAVIDTGKVKETTYDPFNNIVKLEEVWASKAACKQRRGRAGRVHAGDCYKLYTRNAESKMAERPEPEMKRVPLEQLCLSIRAMGIIDIRSFLSKALTPPESLAVDSAINLLGRMGALVDDHLTALGRHMSMIPTDLRCAKLIIYGSTFGCLEACITIAAILTARSPFLSSQLKRDEAKIARRSFAAGHGDLICDLMAYKAWESAKGSSGYREMRDWCNSNALSPQTLNDISTNKIQFTRALLDCGFLSSDYKISSDTEVNAHDDDLPLLRALIAGAFNPQLARIDHPDKKYAPSMSGAIELDPEARTIRFFNEENGRVFVHPSSTLFDAQTFRGNAAYMSYFNKMATSKTFIKELTPLNAYALLLFSGPIELDTLGRGVVVDGWLRLKGWARIGVLISRLRGLFDRVLARKIDNPSSKFDQTDTKIIDLVRRLIEFNGLDR